MTKKSFAVRLFAGLALSLALAANTRAADIVETAVGAGSFKTLVAAVKAAGLVETLQGEGPFTVFAPTDEAFAALPEGTVETLLKPENKAQLQAILLYHVASGKVDSKTVVGLNGVTTVNGQQADISVVDGSVKVDGATVVKADIMCDNGVIHVIDSVILPESKNLPEVATAAKSFSTLLAAAKAAGLVKALSGDDALTVFAPTDDAFAALPEGTVETLLKPENKAKLVEVLTYHVVPGRVYSSQAVKAGTAKTLQGSPITIKVEGESAMVNEAKLLKTDIDASNGVIHVIDSVILPPAEKTSSVSPKQQIEMAIAKGSELFNAGHAESCATLYHTTMKAVLSSDDHGLCNGSVAKMNAVLADAESCGCMNTRAWKLRKGLEVAYAAMD